MVYGLACQASARDGTSSKPLLTTSKRLLDECVVLPPHKTCTELTWSHRVDLTISDEEQSTGVALSAFELAIKKRWHPTQTALLIALAKAAGVTPDWREIDHKVGRGGCEARYKGIRREQICTFPFTPPILRL